MKIAIYGAQGIAFGAYLAIKEIYPEEKVVCFLVTTMDNNAVKLGGLPVVELDRFVEQTSSIEEINVLIATPESVMDEIEKSLEKVGIKHYIRLSSTKWEKLQELLYAKTKTFLPLNLYSKGIGRASVALYQMVHYKDKPLQKKYVYPNYVIPLQVGAIKTNKRVADLVDCEGDNISEKNGNFSELTGLYWIWKHVVEKNINNDKSYTGIIHYRRMFNFSDDDLLRLYDNDIDVILPFPMPYEPNIEVHHERYLSKKEWMAVRQALNEIQPEYAVAFKDVLKQGYLYNYNIILAKNRVLSDYCAWLFPILFRIEEINDPMKKKDPNRYIGYISETLETLYFMYNKNKLKIAYSGCRFLV